MQAVADIAERAGSPVLAQTVHRRFVIELRESVFTDFSPEQVRQLLLHEVAHVLSPEWGHGLAWRRAARKIGYVDAFTFVPTVHELSPFVMKIDALYAQTLDEPRLEFMVAG